MYQIDSKMWSIIYKFDTPKLVTIKDIITTKNSLKYKVEYKNRLFEILNMDMYPSKIDADIFWAITMQEEFKYTQKHPTLFMTDEFEIAVRKADKIILYYAENNPDILLKYF